MTEPALRWVERRRLRVLDFDLENRPLSYVGSDYTTAEVTAIAAGWADEPRIVVQCRTLGTDEGGSLLDMLTWFADLYAQADIVTGHYIRGHDLPVICGAMAEVGLPPLGPKLTSDTKMDLVKMRQMSMKQESLGEMLGAPGKYHMTQPKWREANRLTADGVKLTRKRVMSDVRQHIKLRRVLLERGLLGPPQVWRPFW